MSHPTVTPRTYAVIFAALLGLTLTTVLLANPEVHLGAWEVPVALGIATCKTVLVALFFMHLLHSPRLTWLVVGGGILLLGILLTLTLSDYKTRGWLPEKGGPTSQSAAP
jgi:cytochrome c oxidase subunit 4